MAVINVAEERKGQFYHRTQIVRGHSPMQAIQSANNHVANALKGHVMSLDEVANDPRLITGEHSVQIGQTEVYDISTATEVHVARDEEGYGIALILPYGGIIVTNRASASAPKLDDMSRLCILDRGQWDRLAEGEIEGSERLDVYKAGLKDFEHIPASDSNRVIRLPLVYVSRQSGPDLPVSDSNFELQAYFNGHENLAAMQDKMIQSGKTEFRFNQFVYSLWDNAAERPVSAVVSIRPDFGIGNGTMNTDYAVKTASR